MPLATLPLLGLTVACFRLVICALTAVLTVMLVLTGQANATALQVAPLPGGVRDVIEHFLLSQTAGLPGKVGISIDTPGSDALPPCAAPEPFLPSGARLWGRVVVGVRCNADQPWTRYVPAHVTVVGVYYVAAHAISAGQALTLADAQAREGDLTGIPGSVIMDPAQLSGVTASSRIASGAPLRRELLRAVAIVQRGQTVKVVTQGSGFTVSTQGRAMANAAAGVLVQVRTSGGQLLSGMVRPDGTVEQSP